MRPIRCPLYFVLRRMAVERGQVFPSEGCRSIVASVRLNRARMESINALWGVEIVRAGRSRSSGNPLPYAAAKAESHQEVPTKTRLEGDPCRLGRALHHRPSSISLEALATRLGNWPGALSFESWPGRYV